MALPGSFTKLATAIWVDSADVSMVDVRQLMLEIENALFDLYDKAAATLGSVAGTNTITAAMTPTLDAYVSGQSYWITPANTITGAPTLNIDTVGAKNIFNQAGLALTAGELVANRRYLLVYDGTQFRVQGEPAGDIFKMLFADDTAGQNVNTAQPWFPTAGSLTLPASGTYEFEGLLYLSRAAGTTSHTTGILFGGTATLTMINYLGAAKEGDANTLADLSAFWAAAATELTLKAASTSATEQAMFWVKGVVRINGAGTFIPQFIYSAAPGGAPTVKAGSCFRMRKIPDNATASMGAWA